jgi:hypothetical protein
MVQRCGGNTYEQGESRRGEERRGKETDGCPLTIGETDEEAQGICLAFDDNLDLDVNNIEIKEDDHIFMVHPVDPHHFIHSLSRVSRHLVRLLPRTPHQRDL